MLLAKVAGTQTGIFLAAIFFLEDVYFPERESGGSRWHPHGGLCWDVEPISTS